MIVCRGHTPSALRRGRLIMREKPVKKQGRRHAGLAFCGLLLPVFFAASVFSCYYPQTAPYITGIHLSRDFITLTLDGTAQITARLRPAEALTEGMQVIWEWEISSNPEDVADFAVNSGNDTKEKSAGTVIARNPGTAIIKVKATADGEVFEAECRIEVLPD